MADRAHKMTDEIIDSIEKRLAREYKQATKELEEKLQSYLDQFTEADENQKKMLQAGLITDKDYKDWRFRHMMMNKRWEDMRNTLAADYHATNQAVSGIMRSERANIYALNHNYALYQMEHDGKIDTGLTLYNQDAVERMMKSDPQMLPPPGKKVSKRIAEGKDIRWNNQQIQSVMTQGILQGESIPSLAKRLETVTEHNFTAAMRNARTMATGAQNAGRQEAYERAEKVGVQLVKEWSATLDGRTRHDHRILHGVRVDVDEPFETPDGDVMFPGDPEGPPGQIYNCRCTTLSWVKGFEGETVKSSPKMGGMSFEEWQNGKERLESLNRGSIINTRGITERGMANGLRQSPLHILTESEIAFVKESAKSVDIPLDVLSYNTGKRTGLDTLTGKINVRGDVFPDFASSHNRDNLSARAVLAHEYYGHYLVGDTVLEPGDWRDEFRASYRAALLTPNLNDTERQMLMRDALDRASSAGVTIVYNSDIRRVLYGFEQ